MMTMKIENFFSKMLTKEQWDNPDLMRFSNAEIPASDIELDEAIIDKIISAHRLPLPTDLPTAKTIV